MTKSEIRALFPHTEKGHVYLNHAAISPMSNRVASSVRNFLDSRNSGPIDNFEHWMTITEEAREMISRLIHSEKPDRISFLGNTSDAISAVAEGYGWQENDEIILNTLEFPANIQPFRILEQRGVKLIYLQPDEEGKISAEMIENAISPRTKMVSISAVQYLNGFRADMEAIGMVCNEHDIYFIVDGIQALGAVPIDVRTCRIDALASGGHKWLMGPMGVGFLYLSEKLARHLKPFKTGWLSVENPWELSSFNQAWKPVSRHLETGTFNMAGIIGFHASLKHLLEVGIENIHNEIMELTGYLIKNISTVDHIRVETPRSPDARAGIVAVSLADNHEAEKLVSYLKDNQITVSARQGLVRISPHYYNTEEEIDRILDFIL